MATRTEYPEYRGITPRVTYFLHAEVDGSHYTFEFTEPGTTPDDAWMGLTRELYEVYSTREDPKFTSFDSWIKRIRDMLTENYTVMLYRTDPHTGECLAAAAGFMGETLHYGEVLSYALILNPSKASRGLYKAMNAAARELRIPTWSRSKWLRPMTYEVKFKETLWE